MATEEASANALEEERSSAASTTSKQEPDGPSSCPTVVPNLMLVGCCSQSPEAMQMSVVPDDWGRPRLWILTS